MTEVAERDPKSLILVIADMARSNPPMVSSFVAELARRLQGQSPALALPLTWVEERLSESGRTIKHLVQSENQRQAADQASISNSIGSLRFLETMDWREFVETMSVVEQTLRKDSGGVLRQDGFCDPRPLPPRRGEDSEEQPAIRTRGGARSNPTGACGRCHKRRRRSQWPCRLLPDRQRIAAARASGAELPLSVFETIRKLIRQFPLLSYAGTILLLSAIFTVSLLAEAHASGLQGWRLGLLGVPLLLCVSQFAVALVNWLATLLATPHLLPRMDFSSGIPPESRTLGGGTDYASERSEHRGSDRGAGGPVSGKSGQQPALRPAD